MVTEEQVSRFVEVFLKISSSVRRTGVFNDDMSRQLCVLGGICNFQAREGRRMTITDVSNVTGMALSNVSRFLRPLEERSLVERERQGRTVYLNITEEGRRQFGERVAAVHAILQKMLGALSEEEAEVFLSGSEKLSKALDDIIKQN